MTTTTEGTRRPTGEVAAEAVSRALRDAHAFAAGEKDLTGTGAVTLLTRFVQLHLQAVSSKLGDHFYRWSTDVTCATCGEVWNLDRLREVRDTLAECCRTTAKALQE